jgi:hypothetical protein
MIKSSISDKINKEICNALGCSKNATEEISVTAGKYGTVSLDLCKNCVNLFKEGVIN